MPRERPEAARLWDMLDAARAVRDFVRGRTFEDFARDRFFRGAVERHIEIIGEAAAKVGEEFRRDHPEVPWEKIVVTRHRFVHEYYGLDPVIVWRIATVHVETLIAALDAMDLRPPG